MHSFQDHVVRHCPTTRLDLGSPLWENIGMTPSHAGDGPIRTAFILDRFVTILAAALAPSLLFWNAAQGACDPNHWIGVDRIDSFSGSPPFQHPNRTGGHFYPSCNFIITSQQFTDLTGGPSDFLRVGSYYARFAWETLPSVQTAYPWATFIPSPGCGPNKNCNWRVEGCGPTACGGGSGCSGEIVVEQPAGQSLTDNSSVVAFAATSVGASTSLTFIIKNTSTTQTLSIFNATIDGPNASEFAITQQPFVTGTVLTLVVRFTPRSAGSKGATLHIPNSDCDENPFDIWLSGDGQSPVSAGWTLIGAADFNGDAWPDYLLFNLGTRQTAIWFLNGTTLIRGAYGPTLPFGWRLIGAVNVDILNPAVSPDYVLFNPATRQSAIWFLNGTTLIRGAYGPTLPASWILVAAVGMALESVDLNRDFETDYLLFNPVTRQTAAWFLSGTSVIGGGYGPTLPASWSLIGANDFNRDGWADLLLANVNTRQTALWYLNVITFASAAFGPTLPPGWILKGSADFNRDGKPDYLLFNPSTRQTAVWYMSGAANVGAAYGPTLPR